MNLRGHEPVKGYMVGLRNKGIQVNITEFKPGHIDQFIRANLGALFNPLCYIGTWVNNDIVYIDISLNIVHKEYALRQAKYNGQICIWDVVNKVEIYQLKEETV